ncbi:MAG: hypothetical protein AAGB31_02780 [Bdellovibrio sp.]
MRIIPLLVVAMMFSGQASFAAKKSSDNKFHKICKEENPGASKADIKKCVKEKRSAANVK